MNSQKLKTTLKKIETLGFPPNRFCVRIDDNWTFCPEKTMKADQSLHNEIVLLISMFRECLLDDIGDFVHHREVKAFLKKHKLTIHKRREEKTIEVGYKNGSNEERFRLPL